MFCSNIIILMFCFHLGVNLVFGETTDMTLIAKDPGNVLEFSSDSDVDQNDVLSRIARGIPVSQFSANNYYDSDEMDDFLYDDDDDEYLASRRVFKQVERIANNVAKGANKVASGASKVAKGAATAKKIFNRIRGKKN